MYIILFQLDTQNNLDSLINLAYNLLESPTVEPIVIFVDAINQVTGLFYN